MTEADAIQVLYDAALKLASAGYVLAGELQFIKPKTPGLVRAVAVGQTGEISRLSFTTERVPVKKFDVTSNSRPQGYTGDVCSKCGGARMKRNGTCLVCLDCGSTDGCS